ncbi:long-chain-fatty-acid--CoA ligase [Luteipulveratus halotolerans]|uniref:Long-chain fatty acid--CoA ligase n=1 Tax=Luteipulveratus halotolerans TaxID=1631356 RepID=A0A0L6CLL9_9MICO|nr:long-chain-fatty-acid--CoA ligase [Luteipulveratus halotolerans]KNX38428.1 long-chain fatty acid--CoA ligase [Luteipulveratus halotolerans]
MTGRLSTHRLITDPLEQWARERPDLPAIDYQDQSVTWAELADRVHHVSGALQELGIRAGDRVATLDKNTLASVELTHAAAAIGAAHVIVNWRLLADQLAYVLKDSAPSVVFVGAELLPAYDEIKDQLTGVRKVVVVGGDDDEYEAWLAAASPVEPVADVEPDSTALVLYSSGTTGFPKGIELTHRNLNTHSAATATRFDMDEKSVSLVAMLLFHVGGTCYALGGISRGAHQIILREIDPVQMLQAMGRGVTHIFLVPAVVGAVLAAGDIGVQAFSGLSFLIYGASPMPLPMLQKALAAWPDVNLVQVYGMTELAGVITMLDAPSHRDAAHPERLTSAGTPIPGAEMRVVDPATGDDVETGQVGEAWFRSDQTMRGYLGKPEATTEAKTDDGWMRTGDLGHVDDGGYLYVVDRIKDLIISGGENIYSPEVENVLAAHPAVAEVAIIGVPDEQWGESVRAVVALAPEQQLTADELIAYSRERLAHYKCPSSVDIVEALPRNPSGKVLKRELRKPFWEGRDRAV